MREAGGIAFGAADTGFPDPLHLAEEGSGTGTYLQNNGDTDGRVPDPWPAQGGGCRIDLRSPSVRRAMSARAHDQRRPAASRGQASIAQQCIRPPESLKGECERLEAVSSRQLCLLNSQLSLNECTRRYLQPLIFRLLRSGLELPLSLSQVAVHLDRSPTPASSGFEQPSVPR